MKLNERNDPTKFRSRNLAINNLTAVAMFIVFGFIMHDIISQKMAAKAAEATLPAASSTTAPSLSPVPDASAKTAVEKMASQVILWESQKFTPTATGARVTVFDAPTPTLDKFHCHISTLNPGENTGPLHRHPQEEFIIIKEGTLEVNIDGKKQTATPGSMIFYAANENENMTNVGKVPATYYVIQFYTALTPKS